MSIEITAETIKSAIALKIKNDYIDTLNNSSIKIYKEKIIQNFVTPAFFIWLINASQERLISNNYIQMYEMNIRYHPEENNLSSYEELTTIGNTLFCILETLEITYQNKEEKNITVRLKGIDMDFKITDDVLQFFVNYRVKTKKEITNDDIDEMKILEIKDIKECRR